MTPLETVRSDPPQSSDAARRQAALVRALADEVERRAPAGAADSIRDQLSEEIARLASDDDESSSP